MNKLKDWVSRLKKAHMLSVIGVFIIIIAVLITVLVRKEQDSKQASENSYNMAFYSLVDYVENVETYLAKSLISSTPEHGAETLTNVWREANLAQSYLARLPIESQKLENTEKFLNQVSDYSYSLSRKNIYNESLSDEDLKNLKDLHNYSVELENTLNQLSEDINSGRIKWNELSNKGTVAFAQQVSTQTNDSFSNLEENFHEYSGLIYDGAFSEHITSSEKKGLTGNDIDEETAKQKVSEFVGQENIKEIQSLGFSENATIPEYNFSVKTNLENDIKWSTQKTIMFQAGIIKLCSKQAETSSNLEERLDKIEKYLRTSKVTSNMTMPVQQVQSNEPRMTFGVSSKNSTEFKNTNIPKSNKEKKFSNKSEEYWPQIVNDLKQSGKIVLYTNLMNTKAKEINDMTVGIEFPNGMTSFGKTVLEKPENIREISNLVSIACGKEMQIKYITQNNQVHQMTQEENLQNLANQSDIPFNVIE